MKRENTDVVYTAIFGNYDQVELIRPEWDCDFICFTDNSQMKSNGWQIRITELNNESPSSLNRRYKMFPNIYLSEYKRSLYVDGNVTIISNPKPLFDKYLNENLLAIPRHLDRDCVYEEAARCAKINLNAKGIIEHQMKTYRSEGFPEHFGLSENSIIFRKHNDETIISLMEIWWKEYSQGAKRDQLSLQYVMWKSGFKIAFMSENPRRKNKYFRSISHAKVKELSLGRRFILHTGYNKDWSYFYKIADVIINLLRKIYFKYLS